MKSHDSYGVGPWLAAVAVLCGFLSFMPSSHAETSKLDTVYWCPNRPPDQRYSAKPAPGCTRLFEKNEQQDGQSADQPDTGTPRDPIKLEEIQAEASRFLSEYNQFLECCAKDVESGERLIELDEQATHLLNAMQDTGFIQRYMYQRGMTVSQIITPVEQARANLRKLKREYEQVKGLIGRQPELGYDEAGRDTQVIQELEGAISKQTHPQKMPAGPRTGTEIGVTPAAGAGIGKTPAAGSQIGGGGTTGSDIGTTGKTGAEIGSTGSVGFGIGGTGRAGAEIGESTFNSGSSGVGSSLQQSTVGSSLNDSSVRSSLGSSSVGSSLQDTTLGSSLGSSSVGSSIQKRGDPSQ